MFEIYKDSFGFLSTVKLSIQNQFNQNEKVNENNIINTTSWLQKLLLNETFFGLENTDENNWALRLTSSKDNSIVITREELIQFINLSNSTFGLFKFQKNHSTLSTISLSIFNLKWNLREF